MVEISFKLASSLNLPQFSSQCLVSSVVQAYMSRSNDDYNAEDDGFLEVNANEINSPSLVLENPKLRNKGQCLLSRNDHLDLAGGNIFSRVAFGNRR